MKYFNVNFIGSDIEFQQKQKQNKKKTAQFNT
jgi:hypothetical protein